MAKRTLDEILGALEAKVEESEDKYGHRIWGLYVDANRSLRRGRRPTEADEVLKAGQAFLFMTRRDAEGRYFRPIFSGDGWENPDWTSLDRDVCELYRKRAHQTPSVRARARYADLVWERERDHRMARCAIDSYLELASKYYQKEWLLECQEAIGRSLELAAAISDSKRFRNAIAEALVIHEELSAKNIFEPPRV
ncbi:MAG TPA: hypothetical protein VMR52_08740 [Dehalococcoidia bacterium]|nr:hypothetical protein [Dehalococcoidia bacterium]